jgi:proton-dependent oligopeptide transporter, POT family
MSLPPSSRSSDSASAPAERDDRFPPGIPFIVGNEAAERFSFYGMRAILYVYLTGLFSGFVAESQIPEDAKVRATQVYHLFMAGAYLSPMIGAVMADRWLGKYKLIMWVSLLYVAGHGALAVAGAIGAEGDHARATTIFLFGLAVISLGAGGIKPCVAANVGDQFTKRNAHLVTRVFQIFYFTINFGSFFASLLIPLLNRSYGPDVAFGVPGILMAVATLVFWMGRNRFVKIPPKPGGKLGRMDFFASALLMTPLLLGIFVATEESSKLVGAATEGGAGAVFPALAGIAHEYWWALVASVVGFVLGVVVANVRQRIQPEPSFLSVLLYSFRQRAQRAPGDGFFAPARKQFGEEAAEGPAAVLRIILVFSMVSVFWALFDQHSSTWIEQAKSMDLVLTLPRYLWSYFIVYGTYAAALVAVVGLVCWVANRPFSRRLWQLIFGAFAVWLASVLFFQATRGGWAEIHMLPSQLAALNPLLVMLIIPIINFGVYQPMERIGRPLKPLTRMTIGMFLSALSFVSVAIIQARIDAMGPGHVHALWQLLPYILITTGEVLVSITGLEFAYTQAPRSMKSTLVGVWYLCVTLGNVLVAFLAPLQALSLTTFFWTFAALMGVAAVVFAVLAGMYKGKTYLQA